MATPDVIPDAKTEITAQRDEWLAAANGDVLLRLRIRRWASLAEVCAAAACEKMPKMYNFIYGLGGADTMVSDFMSCFGWGWTKNPPRARTASISSPKRFVVKLG